MGSHHRGPAAEVRALDAYVKLARATNAVGARIHAPLQDDGLTARQLAVLEALHHLGPLTQKDLCEKTLTTGGNVTLVVVNLEKRGLVRRERPPKDRRLVQVTLTPAGRTLIERVFPSHARRVADAFAILSPAEQEQLARLCRKLGRGSAR